MRHLCSERQEPHSAAIQLAAQFLSRNERTEQELLEYMSGFVLCQGLHLTSFRHAQDRSPSAKFENCP